MTIDTLGTGSLLGGTYRLLGHLSTGGMAEVFLASHARLPMKFVVKVLSAESLSRESLEQFRQEATVLAGLAHPNIVQLIDFNWTDSGLPYLVTEYLPGADLATCFEAQRALGDAHIMGILGQIASGLYAAHCRSVVHRDLKPTNVMVVPCDGRRDLIKLIDFGVSMTGGARRAGGDRLVAGTPEFMSPEQALGRADGIGPASDQFSLGVLAYLLIAGRLPWTGSSAGDVLAQVVHGHPEPLPSGMASIEAVLLQALAKNPAERFPSTLALTRTLRRAMLADGLLGQNATLDRPEDNLVSKPLSKEPSNDLSLPPPSSGLEDTAPPLFVDVTPAEKGAPALPDYPATVRVSRIGHRSAMWKWIPVIVGAGLGAMLGLAGPLFKHQGAAALWGRFQVGATHAAEVVLEQGRHVIGRISPPPAQR